MSPVEVVIDLFGGIRGVGDAIGIAPSTVMGWQKSRRRSDGYSDSKPTGRIPLDYFDPLLAAAKSRGLRLTVEHLVWGKPGVQRTVITFLTPTEKPSALEHMAQALSRCSA